MFKIQKKELLDKYSRWRKQAEVRKLSTEARLRLEWMIQLDQGKSVQRICADFGISRSALYKWKKRFVSTHISSLESHARRPHSVRSRRATAHQDERVIALRKHYPYYGKEKLKVVYQRIYQEKITSWYIQRVIQTYKLYPAKRKGKGTTQISRKRTPRKRITHFTEEKTSFGLLLHLDTIEVRIQGKKRYILTAVDSFTRVGFAYAYTNHSSASAKDFLLKLYEIFEGNIQHIHTDNGSEFAGYFERAIQKLELTHWYSRVRVSKDNAKCERLNRTLQDEISMSPHYGWSSDIQALNATLGEWLLEYLYIRPHASLSYDTPLQFLDKVSTMSSSRTVN